jgi:hypothetical protein
MQLLTAQFSAIVNTEPEEHTTDVPKRELPGTIGDSLSPELDACCVATRARAAAVLEDEPARTVSSGRSQRIPGGKAEGATPPAILPVHGPRVGHDCKCIFANYPSSLYRIDHFFFIGLQHHQQQ